MIQNKPCQCEIRKKDEFEGWEDFSNFRETLNASPYFKKIGPLGNSFSKYNLIETWYECILCKKTWLLVDPNSTFVGLWEQRSKDTYDLRDNETLNNLRRLLRLIFTILIAWMLKRLWFK